MSRRNGSHPVAAPAASRCRAMHGHKPTTANPACDECWEVAIEADREIAAELELPAVCPQDTDLVDTVAVDRAINGEVVELTVREWRLARRILEGRGVHSTIALRQLSAVTVVNGLGNPISGRRAAAQPSRYFVDLVAIQHRMNGRPIELTPSELRTAVQRLAADGCSHRAIADRLRVRHSTVAKAIRSSIGLPDRDGAILATASSFHAECTTSDLQAVA